MNVTLFISSVVAEQETHIDIQDFQSKNDGKIRERKKTQNGEKTNHSPGYKDVHCIIMKVSLLCEFRAHASLAFEWMTTLPGYKP